MGRIAFEFRVRPEMFDEYVRRHNPIWPELAASLRTAGIRDYSIFLTSGGSLIGSYTTDDPDATNAFLANDRVSADWDRDMQRFFVTDPDGRVAVTLTEVFCLDDDVQVASSELLTEPGDGPDLRR